MPYEEQIIHKRHAIYDMAGVICLQSAGINKKRKRLWYRTEAKDWESQALPLGNGRLGAMFYGGLEEEVIQFNEETLYSGRPEGVDENAWKHLERIRKCLAQKDYRQAQEILDRDYLKKASFGDVSNFGEYQNFGEIRIRFAHMDNVCNYRRELDLEDAVGHVSFQSGQRHYTREYFASHPDRIFTGRLSCDTPGSMSADIRMLPGQEAGNLLCEDNRLILRGNTGYMEFEAVLEICARGGSIVRGENVLQIRNADEIFLFLTASTEYDAGADDYRGKDYVQYNRTVLKKARSMTYEKLRDRHIADYQQLFGRAQIRLKEETEDIPTDELLVRYGQGEKSPWLEILTFDYARYLLIASSREDTLPANLQGVWNNSNRPEWGSIFCYNINFNMNYWMAHKATGRNPARIFG